jgi:hypothetical protein
LGTAFRVHVKEIPTAAARATHDVRNLDLSLEITMTFLNLMIVLVLTYGKEFFWKHLTENDSQLLKNMKASYLKKKEYWRHF